MFPAQREAEVSVDVGSLKYGDEEIWGPSESDFYQFHPESIIACLVSKAPDYKCLVASHCSLG